MLPAETVEKIEEMAHKAMEPIVAAKAEPPHIYYIRKPDGSLERQSALESPARHTAADIPTLCQVVKDQADDEGENVPVVWYSRSGIVAVLQPESLHPDHCTFKLTPSPQFATLLNWDHNGRTQYTQGDLIIALRTLFKDSAPSALLPAVRKVKTSKAADMQQQIDQGRVSLGKSMVAEMTGVNAIPEEVIFDFPIFAEAAVSSIRGQVRICIDPDPETGRFTLIVLPGDCERAYSKAEDFLGGLLDETLTGIFDSASYPVPVYRGTP